ncbi:hypothetical protein ILUMI_13814 [Ignelater luminosus]|uniref:Uncharacterized protein n=1 Tax=Ignelater luminosus TaxID=2038154 RepID=A0A8K0G5F9_IGNLU|nr:hypothetical protein ILUMI_13814 [Ignelater luminosus]
MPSRGRILVDLALSIVGQHDVVPGLPEIFEYSTSVNTEIENVNSAENSNSVLAPLTNVDYNAFEVISEELSDNLDSEQFVPVERYEFDSDDSIEDRTFTGNSCSDSSDSVAENVQNKAKTQIQVNQVSNVSIENETLITEQVMRRYRKRVAQRSCGNRRKPIDSAVKDAIRKHISSFARIESHYLRSQTTRPLIDGSLSILQMYCYYQEEQQNAGLSTAKKNSYEYIFNTQLHISFFTPKTDQCSVCESFKNSSEEEQRNLKESYDQHIENKNLSKKQKADDIARATENPSIIVACYDLQAILPTPCGDISTYYFGHTQNERYAMHATIKREKKRILKSGPIYVASQ